MDPLEQKMWDLGYGLRPAPHVAGVRGVSLEWVKRRDDPGEPWMTPEEARAIFNEESLFLAQQGVDPIPSRSSES